MAANDKKKLKIIAIDVTSKYTFYLRFVCAMHFYAY